MAVDMYGLLKSGVDTRVKTLETSITNLSTKEKELKNKIKNLEAKKRSMLPSTYIDELNLLKQELNKTESHLAENHRRHRLYTMNGHYPQRDDDLISLNYLADKIGINAVYLIGNKENAYTQKTLLSDYNALLKYIDNQVDKKTLDKTLADKVLEELHLVYTHFIRSAPLEEIKKPVNPKYDEFMAEILQRRTNINNLEIKKKEYQDAIDKLYNLQNELSRKNLSNTKYQYEKLSLEIKIGELELKIKAIDISIRIDENWILQNQLKIESLEKKIDVHEYSFKIEQTRLDKSIYENIANIDYNILEQEILKKKSTLLNYAEMLKLIRSEQRISSQKVNREKTKKLDQENEYTMQEINDNYKKQISFQIAYRFKTKEITMQVRNAQVEALDKIRDFDYNTHIYIASITDSKVEMPLKK